MSESLSAGPDARWLKRGGRCLFDCKGFVCADVDGCVERVQVRPARRGRGSCSGSPGDIPCLGTATDRQACKPMHIEKSRPDKLLDHRQTTAPTPL